MGGGIHGGFGNTFGAICGDAVFKTNPIEYFININKRKDKDKNGIYDVVAHGGINILQIQHKEETIEIDARIAAKIIRNKPDYTQGQPLRLLSCNTGLSDVGFAQNLANKLNVIVEAPTKLVWAYPDGRYIIASCDQNNPQQPNLNDLGFFKKFYPGGNIK